MSLRSSLFLCFGALTFTLLGCSSDSGVNPTGSAGTPGGAGTPGQAGSGGNGVPSGGSANPAGGQSTSGAANGAGAGSSAGGAAGNSTGGSTAGGSAGSGGANTTGGSSGGTAGASGGSNGGGSNGGGRGTICSFASGVNVAWVNFAHDVPNPDLNTFNTIFKNTHDAGGRVIRWWFHTNGSSTPGYDAQGMTQKLPQSHIDGVKAILNAAHTQGVGIVLSLWSFDMMQDNAGDAWTNNQKLLEVDANRQAYIDNYLTPLVKALKGTPGLYAYEIFNEPEGMCENGWATHRTKIQFVKRTVNWLSAAIHEADAVTPVTNGAQTFDYCSKAAGKQNHYSDDALKEAGGKATGTLDFYQVHYYAVNGIGNSPYKHPASYWGLDKKLVMGEFFTRDTDDVKKDDLYTYFFSNGYNGAWAWAYTADEVWPSMQKPMQNLDAAQPNVKSCP